jgi:hypothetical protein
VRYPCGSCSTGTAIRHSAPPAGSLPAD